MINVQKCQLLLLEFLKCYLETFRVKETVFLFNFLLIQFLSQITTKKGEWRERERQTDRSSFFSFPFTSISFCLNPFALPTGVQKCTCFGCGGIRRGAHQACILTHPCPSIQQYIQSVVCIALQAVKSMITGTCIFLSDIIKNPSLPVLHLRSLIQIFVFIHRLNRCGIKCWCTVVCGQALDKSDFTG